MNLYKKPYAKTLRIIGVTVFIIGILSGATLALFTSWSGLEGAFYGFSPVTKNPLENLDCPYIVTSKQPGLVTVDFSNPSDKTIEPFVRTQVSNHGIYREEEYRMYMEPGGKDQLVFEVNYEDVVLGRFVLVRVYQLTTIKSSPREGICGMMALDVPYLSGEGLFTLMLTVGLFGITIGLFLLTQTSQPTNPHQRNLDRGLTGLALLILIAMFFGFIRFWVGGIIFVIAAALLLVTLLSILARD